MVSWKIGGTAYVAFCIVACSARTDVGDAMPSAPAEDDPSTEYADTGRSLADPTPRAAIAIEQMAAEVPAREADAASRPGDCVESFAGSHKFIVYVLSEYDNAINVVDSVTNSVIFTVTAPGSIARPHRAWVHPSYKRLYVSNKAGGKLLAFDISNPRVAPRLVNEVFLGPADLHNIQITGASSCAIDGTVWVSYAGNMNPGDASFVGAYTASDLTLVRKVTTGMTSAHGMLMRPGTNELWVTNRPPTPYGNLIRIDTLTGNPLSAPVMNLPTLAQVEDQPNNMAFTEGGAQAYVVNQGDDHNINVPTTVTIVNGTTFSVDHQLELDPLLGRRPHALTYDPRRKWMWICTRLGGAVVVIDTVAQPLPRVVTHIPVGVECHDVILTPDGRFAYTSSMGGPGVATTTTGRPWWEDNVKVIDASTLQVVKTIPVPSHAIVMRPY